MTPEEELKNQLARYDADLEAAKLLIEHLQAKNARQRIEALGSMSLSDYQRLVEWIKNPDRKPAEAAFTAGYLRDAARAFEEGTRKP